MNNMNIHGVGMNQPVGGQGVGMPMPGVPSGIMQQASPQQMQQAMPQQPLQPPDKLDNVSKVKSLVGQLRESLTVTLKSAAQVVHQNYLVDVGSQKGLDTPVPRFDKNMEEFYSLCDQIELHLKTSVACLQQAGWAAQHLPLPVSVYRVDPPPPPEPPAPPTLSYPQFLSTARAQVAYAKEIHDTLVAAAQNISPTE